MNNKVQQRFDRSIREAGEQVQAMADTKREADIKAAQEKAYRILKKAYAAYANSVGTRRKNVVLSVIRRYRKVVGIPINDPIPTEVK